MPHRIQDGRIEELIPPSLALDDPAFQYGALGFFETLRVESRRVVLWYEHLARLHASLSKWRILPPDDSLLRKAVASELETHQPESNLRLKIIVGPDPTAPSNGQDLTPSRTFVIATPLQQPKKATRGIKLTIFNDYAISSTHPLTGHKATSNYYLYWEALCRVRARGFDEALLLNERGEIAEACTANVVWFSNGQWFTPARECGNLPGVELGFLESILRQKGQTLERVKATPEILRNAEAVALTNSIIGLSPVSEIENLGLRFESPSWLEELSSEIRNAPGETF